nr:iron ABC transporter permease [Pararhizobium haloflavum]
MRSKARSATSQAALFGALAALVIVTALTAVSVGAYPVTLSDLLALMVGRAPADPQAATVVQSIRLPRVLAALALGACLAAAGSVFQQIFRNPLVSPDILGVSAGAGLGAVLGIFLSLPVPGIQFLAFAGGLGAVFCVMAIAGVVRRQDTILVLVLSGVVIGALAGSATSLIKVLADPYDQLPAITFWLLGSLAAIHANDMTAALPVAACAMIPLILLRWKVDVLAMGDEEACALGVDTRRIRLILILAATLITASVVSFAGVVGWVGLIIPHCARMLVGPGFARLLPTAILLGAIFMIIVDTIARSIAATEVPLGILTSVIGAPVFVFLMARGRNAWS